MNNNLPKNKKAVGKAAYATALLALIIAGVVALNVIVTALADRYPLSVDMTTLGTYTLSDENVELLQTVENKTEIVILASEEDYTGGYYEYFVQQSYSVSGSANEYFRQTVELLNQYEKYNENITVTFTDPYDPDFSATASRFSDLSYYYGDILIAITDEAGNETHEYLGFQDIYELASSYYYYTVAGNNIESAVASKLSTLSGGLGLNIAVLADYCEDSTVSAIESVLTANNCTFEEISALQISEISSEYDAVLIAAPSKDMGETETLAVNNFLNNNGEGGKTVLYFASAYSPDTPNIEQLLNEWGVATEDGVLYETNTQNHLQDEPTTISLINNDTDYAASDSNVIYISGNNVPLTQVFESHDTRSTELVFSSASTTVIKPSNADENWAGSIDSSSAQSYPAVVACTDTAGTAPSTLIVFSSDDFVNSQWLSYSSVGNSKSFISIVSVASGNEGANLNLVTKTIESAYFTDLNTGVLSFFKMLFTFLLPAGVIAVGVAVIYRRRHAR